MIDEVFESQIIPLKGKYPLALALTYLPHTRGIMSMFYILASLTLNSPFSFHPRYCWDRYGCTTLAPI